MKEKKEILAVSQSQCRFAFSRKFSSALTSAAFKMTQLMVLLLLSLIIILANFCTVL